MSRVDPNHVHKMSVFSWNTGPDPAYAAVYPGSDRPAVLLSCFGNCGKIEFCRPTNRHRKVPLGLTTEQFKALQAGTYWPDIVGLA